MNNEIRGTHYRESFPKNTEGLQRDTYGDNKEGEKTNETTKASTPKNVRGLFMGLFEKIRQINILKKLDLMAPGTPTQVGNEIDVLKRNIEAESTIDGVDYSKAQLKDFAEAYLGGMEAEIDCFTPYLSDYNSVTGEIWRNNLLPADSNALDILARLKKLLPKSKIICLYDEYNSVAPDIGNSITGKPEARNPDAKGRETDQHSMLPFSEEARVGFAESARSLLHERGIVSSSEDVTMIAESAKVEDVKALVTMLKKEGLLEGDLENPNEALYFNNPGAENPDFQRIKLRNTTGKWMCPALDASSFLKPENLTKLHLVILPKHFKDQQDQVWEILRVLGIKPENYHNIYFDAEDSNASENIAKQFAIALESTTQTN